jgi:uncharacterized membrane protein YdbT with pleckstrin-like domain
MSNTALTDEERAELEALRAAKRETDEAERARQERAELENLRKSQKYAQEDAEYYAERARRRAERERERENPDFGVDDLEPMSLKQKIVMAVLGVVLLAFVAIIVSAHLG